MAASVVRLRRRGGAVVQDCDVYIGRACYRGGWELPQSKWHNPFSVARHGREGALAMYRAHVLASPALVAALPELRGRRLGCWCKPDACHGDVLVELLGAAPAAPLV